MNSSQWNWADLDNEQLKLLIEAEQTLGADILVAYQAGNRATVHGDNISQNNLEVAVLDESQIECLQGLEQKMNSVVIAYNRSGG